MFSSRWTVIVGVLSVLVYAFLRRASIELVFHPDRYHGHGVSNGIFFEGWYYKMVLDQYASTIVVIPGVHMNDDRRHAFVMVAYDNISHYFRFPFETFSSASNEFLVTMDEEKNVFSSEQLMIDLRPKDGDDALESFQMNFTLSSHVAIPDLAWFAPGTMGPYSWIPTMQCNHHVLSMNHDLHGSMRIDGRDYRNVSGRGYIEKDWGHSFPSMWVWGQANQWRNLPLKSTASLFFSLALIPWYFTLEFAGFLVVFQYNDQFYRFNTYLQSVVHNLAIDNATNRVSFDVYDVQFVYKLRVSAHCSDVDRIHGAMLYGPRAGRMEKFVQEILAKNNYFDVQLFKLTHNATHQRDDGDLFAQHGYSAETLFDYRAENIALEITGDVDWLSGQFQATYGHVYPWTFSLIRWAVTTMRG